MDIRWHFSAIHTHEQSALNRLFETSEFMFEHILIFFAHTHTNVPTWSTEPQAHTSTEYTPIHSCIIEERDSPLPLLEEGSERGKRGIKPEEDERTFRTASWKVGLCLGCFLYAEIRRVSRHHRAEAQDTDLVAAAKQPRPVLQTATWERQKGWEGKRQREREPPRPTPSSLSLRVHTRRFADEKVRITVVANLVTAVKNLFEARRGRISLCHERVVQCTFCVCVCLFATRARTNQTGLRLRVVWRRLPVCGHWC